MVLDGLPHLVSFAALPRASGGSVVEGTLRIQALGAERDLLPPDEHPMAGRGLFALGDPDFDLGSSPAVAAAYRGQASQCPEFAKLRWQRLAGARNEVEDVGHIWDSHAAVASGDPTGSSPAATVLTGARATESAFKRLAPGHAFLHLATHGFFIGGSCRVAPPGARGIAGLTPAPDGVRRVEPGGPLELAGLVLAGANRRAEATPSEDDGVLTSEEIAALDLRGVEWAVLSACETGIGQVRSGEGVLGLRRAFQVAGARTVIMSLWSVEDESTRRWMHALYDARLRDGLGTADAVRDASLAVIKERRARGLSTHPFFWGAFVAAGDWH